MINSYFYTHFFTAMEEKELKDKSLNEKESLELITRMIQNTQHRLERHTGMPMLIWGYATTVTTLLVWWAVNYTSDYRTQFLWFLIPLTGGIGLFLWKKKPAGVRTYVDRFSAVVPVDVQRDVEAADSVYHHIDHGYRNDPDRVGCTVQAAGHRRRGGDGDRSSPLPVAGLGYKDADICVSLCRHDDYSGIYLKPSS